jgi:hypothetical protein
MKKLLLAAAALVALSLPASASIIGPGFGINPTSAAGAFSNDPNGPGVGGVFFDQYLFNLVGGPAFVTVTTASNTFAIGGITGPFGIQGFTGAIYEIVGAVDPLPGGDDILKFGPQVASLCGSGLCQQLDGVGLMLPGSYYLAIAGNAGQFAGYGGNLSVAETPIPGAVWLFASGAAGLGALLRRRKKKEAAQLAAA